MKKYNDRWYETHEDWHPVVIRNVGNFMDDQIIRPEWLREHCPGYEADYDAWVYESDQFGDPRHRTIYFFRDQEVAVMFALRWS